MAVVLLNAIETHGVEGRGPLVVMAVFMELPQGRQGPDRGLAVAHLASGQVKQRGGRNRGENDLMTPPPQPRT